MELGEEAKETYPYWLNILQQECTGYVSDDITVKIKFKRHIKI